MEIRPRVVYDPDALPDADEVIPKHIASKWDASNALAHEAFYVALVLMSAYLVYAHLADRTLTRVHVVRSVGIALVVIMLAFVSGQIQNAGKFTGHIVYQYAMAAMPLFVTGMVYGAVRLIRRQGQVDGVGTRADDMRVDDARVHHAAPTPLLEGGRPPHVDVHRSMGDMVSAKVDATTSVGASSLLEMAPALIRRLKDARSGRLLPVMEGDRNGEESENEATSHPRLPAAPVRPIRRRTEPSAGNDDMPPPRRRARRS